MLTLEAEKCPDMDELCESFEKGVLDDNVAFKPEVAVYNKRMRDVIVDMDRLGYI